MLYDSNSHIENAEEVETFFRHLSSERNLSFHPDDMFESYVSCEGGKTFSLEECAVYNRLMDECFAVCEKESKDIYGIWLDVVL